MPDLPESQNPGGHPSLTHALVAFQADLPHVAKSQTADVPTKSGGSYSYTYADLSDIVRVAYPVMTRHGLAFTSGPDVRDGHSVLAWRLLHTTGGEITGAYLMPSGARTPQEIGGQITYARRYSLVSALGLAPDDDDDGARAEAAVRQQRGGAGGRPPAEGLRGRAQQAQQQVDDARPGPASISATTMKALHASFGEIGVEDREDKLNYANAVLEAFAQQRGLDVPTITSTTELTESQAKIVIAALKADAEGAPR